MKAPLALAVVVLSTLLVAAVAACTDEPETSAAPTAPSASLSTAAEVAPVPAAMIGGGTVCLSYGRDRELVRAELKDKPGNEALQTKLKALDALILDAC